VTLEGRGVVSGGIVFVDHCRGCRRGRVTERTVTGVLREIGGRERR